MLRCGATETASRCWSTQSSLVAIVPSLCKCANGFWGTKHAGRSAGSSLPPTIVRHGAAEQHPIPRGDASKLVPV